MRGAAIAAFAVLAASLAHTVGGGSPPGVLAIVLALAFATPVTMLLVGRRTTPRRATAAALVAQAALHLLYAVGSPLGATAPSVDPHALHAGGTIPIGAFVAVDHGHAGMPVAHVAAALLTVVFLAVLARSLDSLATLGDAFARGIRLLVAVLAGVPVPYRATRRLPAVRRTGPPDLSLVFLSTLRHRGPPVGLAAA